MNGVWISPTSTAVTRLLNIVSFIVAKADPVIRAWKTRVDTSMTRSKLEFSGRSIRGRLVPER